jgi:hypothetical protein
MSKIDAEELAAALTRNEDFRELVASAIKDAFPEHRAITEAIQKGIENSFPFPSEISNDIYGATLQAMRERKK